MLTVEKELAERLGQMGVKIDAPDKHTVVLQDVPTDQRFFNKAATNLLVKQTREGARLLVCVDADLEYTGNNAFLSAAFSSGPKQAGWRAVFAGKQTDGVQDVVEQAFAALGVYGEPSAPGSAASADGANALSALATNLTEAVRNGPREITVGRDEEVTEAAACLLRWGQARIPVILGASGVGKTNLVKAVAARLLDARPEMTVYVSDVAHLFAGTLFPSEKEGMLASLLEAARTTPDTVLGLDRVDLIAEETPHGAELLSRASDLGARLICTASSSGFCRPGGPLSRRLDVIELCELSEEETDRALLALREPIAEFHGVEIEDSSIRACVLLSRSLPGSLPAKAIALLDAAAARSALVGSTVVGRDDLQSMAQRRTNRSHRNGGGA